MKLEIDSQSVIPKYLQIVDGVISLLNDGKLRRGDQMPSINTLSSTLGVGRVTVVNAYNELKNLEVLDASHGRGFFIRKNGNNVKKKVFLLFDVMNGYKEVLYRSFKKALGRNYTVDIFFYYYNYREFCRLIQDNLKNYNYYVILPHFNFDVSEPLCKIPQEKLIIMDKDVEKLNEGYAAVFQNFHKDTYEGLVSIVDQIRKYKKFILILKDEFQFIPTGILTGFISFCNDHSIECIIKENLEYDDVITGQIYFAVSDSDLITIIRKVKDNKYKLGKDLGVVSRNDTPMKSVLANGITVSTTDFEHMGTTAAKMIKKRRFAKIENPSMLILRNSV